MRKIYLFFFFLTWLNHQALAEKIDCKPQTIAPACLLDFDSNPLKAKQVIQITLDLAAQNIGYKYGSSNPANGGMDCSGTIYYLLTRLGIKNVPRSSESLYQWVKKRGSFYSVQSRHFNDNEFSYLKPGDLLFWSGTYQAKNNPCATHVMLYLGKNKENKPLMAGSSDGRTYKGKKIYGVSVFDFKLPTKHSKSSFLGYSCIPKFTCNS
jgi:hypothetical protein